MPKSSQNPEKHYKNHQNGPKKHKPKQSADVNFVENAHEIVKFDPKSTVVAKFVV
jgi:hypothetical protein